MLSLKGTVDGIDNKGMSIKSTEGNVSKQQPLSITKVLNKV